MEVCTNQEALGGTQQQEMAVTYVSHQNSKQNRWQRNTLNQS